MLLIDYLTSRQIINSRGEPAVEVSLFLNNGVSITASSPSGKSVSSHEAIELVDKDFSNYFGRSVEHAVRNVNETIAPRLKKLDPGGQEKIDQILVELDGTPNMAHMGANATLAVSIAVARAGAVARGKELYEHLNDLFRGIEVRDRHGEHFDLVGSQKEARLPIPMFNIIGGGAHSNNKIPIQEFLVMPVGVERVANQIRAGAEIRWETGQLLEKAGHLTTVNDEGAFGPQYDEPLEPFKLLVEAVNKTNYRLGNNVLYGFDVAGNKIPDDFYSTVLPNYPVVSVEDPYNEDDFAGFSKINEDYPDVFTVGDDLTATNLERLSKAVELNAVDSVIVKPNQIGTVTETLKFAKVAKHESLELFASHRSGETLDTFIVDLSIAIGAKFLKAGAPVRGERVAKYNRLLELAKHFEIDNKEN